MLNSFQHLPNFGEASPDFGESLPNFGGSPPNFGKCLPNFGESPPNFGESLPKFGESPPNFGGRKAVMLNSFQHLQLSYIDSENPFGMTNI